MIERIVSAGDKVDIERVNPETKEKCSYKSQVFEIMENDEIRIAMPFDGSRLVLLSLDTRYKMYFYTVNGLFECMGRVIDRFKSGNRYIAVINLKTGLRKIQRREFFRLEKLIDIDYRILSEEESICEDIEKLFAMEESAIEFPAYRKGIAVDLSGGGARFILDDAYPVDTYILLRMNISLEPGQSEFCVIGRVVMSERLGGKTGQCENRMEFVRIRESMREKLIHYIFREERKMRQNGKS